MTKIIYFSFAFAFSELLLALVKRSKTGKVKRRDDKGSLILLWITITLGFVAGFKFSRPINQFFLGAGYTFIIAGIIIRWLAILDLGKSFTVDVAITEASVLKTDGMYERIRHPSYSGLLLIVLGFSCAMSSFYSFLLLPVPVFIIMCYRISIEEKLLISEFGNDYLKYKSRTKRIIPCIW